MKTKVCSIEGCEREAIARGLCKFHYHLEWSKGLPPLPPLPPKQLCSIEGCGQKYHAKGVCIRHYHLQYNRRPEVVVRKKEYDEKYREKNEEKLRSHRQEWSQINKEEISAKSRQKHLNLLPEELAKLNKYKQNWYTAHKERILQKAGIYRRELRLKVISHYSQGKNECACCGEKHMEFLTINHMNGGGTKHRIQLSGGGKKVSGNIFYKWLVKNNFPEGYNVLCDNCNSSLGRYGYCPHQKEKIILNQTDVKGIY